MLIVKLATLASLLLATSNAAPQLFPFTNLRKFFDHQAKINLDDSANRAVAAEPELRQPSVKVESIAAPKPGKVPKKPVHRYDADESGPYGVYAPTPVQTLSPPTPQAPAFDYSGFFDQLTKANSPSVFQTETNRPSFDKTNSAASNVFQLGASSPVTDKPEEFIEIFREAPRSATYPKLTGGSLFTPTNPHGVLFKPAQPQDALFKPAQPQDALYKPVQPQGALFKPSQHIQPIPLTPTLRPEVVALTKPPGGSYKNVLATTNKYPKKYRPTTVEVGQGDVVTGGKPPKKYSAVKKERWATEKYNVAKTLNAANFQNAPVDEPLQSYRKQGAGGNAGGASFGIDEQHTAESGFSGISSGAGGFGGGDGGFGGAHHGGGGGGGGGDRVEFQMHGHQGPNSYKFGYDTGKGHNRQFRYEERDKHGHVKGHYGFYDKHGKLQHVNYSADHHGFHAGGNFGDGAVGVN